MNTVPSQPFVLFFSINFVIASRIPKQREKERNREKQRETERDKADDYDYVFLPYGLSYGHDKKTRPPETDFAFSYPAACVYFYSPEKPQKLHQDKNIGLQKLRKTKESHKKPTKSHQKLKNIRVALIHIESTRFNTRGGVQFST